MTSRQIEQYRDKEISSVVSLKPDVFALIHMNDSYVYFYDMTKQAEYARIEIPKERRTFWNSLQPFGYNEKLETAFLLLKGMKTLNLIDVNSKQVTFIAD